MESLAKWSVDWVMGWEKIAWGKVLPQQQVFRLRMGCLEWESSSWGEFAERGRGFEAVEAGPSASGGG